jgi:hypothetical protein
MTDRLFKKICNAYTYGFVFIVLLCLFRVRNIFGKGLDFTDNTLCFHFSTKIASGLMPYRDFDMPTTPLAHYIEAMFLLIFGKYFIIDSILGLFVIIFQCFAAFLILSLFMDKLKSSIVVAFIILSDTGYSGSFGFSPLSTLLVAFTVYTFLLYAKSFSYKLLWITSIMCSFTFLTKQNHGMFLFLSLLFFIILFNIKDLKKAFKPIIITIIGFLAPFIFYCLYLWFAGGFSVFIENIFLESAEKKAIMKDGLAGLIHTTAGIISVKLAIGTLIALIMLYLYMFKEGMLKNIALTYIIVSIVALPLSKLASPSLSDHLYQEITRYTTFFSSVMWYDAMRITALTYLFYCFYLLIKNSLGSINRLFFCLSIAMLTITFSSQLSYPGRELMHALLPTLYFFVFMEIQVKQLLNKTGEVYVEINQKTG